MAFFIIGILFFVIAAILGVFAIIEKESLLWALGAVVIGVVLVLVSCIATVPTGHTGILTTMGRVEDTTFDAGLHFKAPWQKVVKMDNRVQKTTEELSCFSSDIQEVNIRYTLNYQISKANAQDLYRGVGREYSSVVIGPNIAEAVKVATAKYTAEELVSARADLAVKIEEILADQLALYNIEVVSTAVEDMDFTDAFTTAVEQKQVAVQNKLKAETEQAQKTMEQEQIAQRSVIEANAAADVAKIQAQADLEVTKIQADAAEYAGLKEAAKNKAISEQLTGDLLTYYYIQQWSGKLPETVMGSDVNALFNIK